MRESNVIPAMVFGALLGAVVTLAVRNPQGLPVSLIPSLVSGATTVAVGWWIHTAVRRRGELDRIPVEYLSDLGRRIGESVSACFVATGGERTAAFRRLGIEVAGLREIARRMSGSAIRDMEKALVSRYIDFKRHLTDDEAMDEGRALKASSEMRMTVLQMQWRLSKRFLDRAEDVDVLAAE